MATHLTGRYSDFVLFPLSFKEFLEFNKFKCNKEVFYSTRLRSVISGFFDQYLKTGGVFEYYKFGKEFLRTLWSSIITKDIVVRYGIKHPLIIEELSLLLINYAASKISVSNLTRHLQIKSPHTINQYIRYLENSFLIISVNKFSYKMKEQMSAFKKLYIIDNGFVNALSFQFSENKGWMLENLAAIELKRRSTREGFEVFYWDNYHAECDFIVKKGKKITMAYQVCREITPENKKREITGLVKALEEFGLKKGIILTESAENIIKSGAFEIYCIPIWKWLLQPESIRRV